MNEYEPRDPGTGRFASQPADDADPDAHWRSRADHLVAHRARYDIFPRGGSLRAWLNAQRAAARAGTMRAARRAYLDQVAPGWLPSRRDPEKTWRENAVLVGEFMKATGRRPSRLAEGEEGRLGRWSASQRARGVSPWPGTHSVSRLEHLNAVAPGWAGDTAVEG